jgi:rare lipoprotein A
VTEAADSATVAGPAKVKEPEPAEAAAAEATPEVAASTGSRPIQVASFSKEDNAKRAADALAKIGITATPQKSERNGKAVWGVVVTGDDAMLAKIKDAGFADAYYLK